MKTKKFLVLIFLLIFTSCVLAQSKEPNIVWKNLQEKYEKFEEVKPVIENPIEGSIFLARISPLWSAGLIGFNEQSQKWENRSGLSILCYTVDNPEVPIEIKSRQDRNISVLWTTKSDYQILFSYIKKNPDSNRKKIGPTIKKYKLVLFYALEPWTRQQTPKQIYKTVSPEFEVAGIE